MGYGITWTFTEGIFGEGLSPLFAGNGCEARDTRTVTCVGALEQLTVNLLDGDDSFRLLELSKLAPVFVDGGPGADSLEGSLSNDTLIGGEGPGELHGDGGRDQLLGQAGRDLLADDDGLRPDSDVLDGGRGRDRVNYTQRAAPVRVDLRAAGPAGGSGRG